MPAVRNSLTGEVAVFKWPYDNTSNDGPFLEAWGMVTELELRYSIQEHPGTINVSILLFTSK